MTEILNAQRREATGTLRMRRLRGQGQIPAVLYGHGQDNVNLQIDAREVASVVRRGSHFVDLQGAVQDHAMISHVQWDQMGSEILHLDFTRIDLTEQVELDLPIDLKGDAPGLKAGGVLNFATHAVRVKGAANVLPDRLELRIGGLELNQSLTAGQIPLPPGVTLVTPADIMIVDCYVPVVREAEAAPEAGAPAEPEVITRRPAEEGEAGEGE